MGKFIKSEKQIDNIRKSGIILSATLKELAKQVKPGVKPVDLDMLARELIEKKGGTPAFLGYKPEGALYPFPFALCVSVNEVIVHGRPSDNPLKEGDIVTLDLGVDWQGGISDSAITIPVGKITKEAQHLIELTSRALDKAIDEVKPGKTVGDIGHAVEKTVRLGGLNIVDGLTGHGVGEKVHEDPVIYNFGEPNTGMELKPGMVIAIEPMVSMGGKGIKQLADDSFVTSDGSLSAQFEHTVLVTSGGNEILTK
ncbi:MAG: Methionine aminopeptidase [Parcubacteria group bacterium GW2011_GWB1_45_7]|uniref:Methionine aminopeptidase n=4 Tax=Parcubacteria group TaxID=1794811 RepID=A0A0H4TF02_9BACT|nr:methionine aminopeptidase, methionyl aminopeptidase [uncultured Parcubacteria bacterium Rifle_16ft_4_minimus_37647]AKQ05600.1 methionine aminopeptidase, methionyl aminopeptidase [uncultured Parcubacteria bacterium Rifle_16ft_4_minimus_23790]KKU11928.1 MAG: Methionine aminopeptidase [Parcubacteria group bacterium GW2011_GWB1_45_7]OGY58615.1 MAG: type I methionyl aminopeptidase [Candidatus Colwellbacteria bacterium RIFCSPHIGHO2_02_FULL_45_17]OGY61710.1 MAG: type I methionyl aminopeptidase [Can